MLRTVALDVKSAKRVIRFATSASLTTQAQSTGQISVPDIPQPRRTGLPASYARGTGGRLSFSGNVCTVFGVSGFVGPLVVDSLVKDGTQLIVPYRGDPFDLKHLKTSGDLGQVLFFPFYLKDEDSIRKVVKHSNIVVNMIGREYPTVNFSLHDVNAEGARRIARISREMGVKRLIHFSAMNATEKPEEFFIPGGSVYLKSKALGERYVRDEFPEAIIVRPSDIYGFRDRFFFSYAHAFRHHALSRISLYRRGEYSYKSPVYIANVAEGVQQLVRDPTCDGKTFEFCGPHWYLFADLIDYVYRICHRDIGSYGRQHIGPWMTFKTNFWELTRWVHRRHIKYDWESIERTECTSDLLTGCPTLEDLGVNLNVVEEKLIYLLELFDTRNSYKPDIGEFPEPPLPPRLAPMYKPREVKLSEKYETTVKRTLLGAIA